MQNIAISTATYFLISSTPHAITLSKCYSSQTPLIDPIDRGGESRFYLLRLHHTKLTRLGSGENIGLIHSFCVRRRGLVEAGVGGAYAVGEGHHVFG